MVQASDPGSVSMHLNPHVKADILLLSAASLIVTCPLSIVALLLCCELGFPAWLTSVAPAAAASRLPVFPATASPGVGLSRRLLLRRLLWFY